MFTSRQHRRVQFRLLAALSIAACASSPAFSQWIQYRAWLKSPGGELHFGLHLEFADHSLKSAEIINGQEVLAISDFALNSDRLTLRFPHYNSEIVAELSQDRVRIDGLWTKRSGKKLTEMDFHAEWLASHAEGIPLTERPSKIDAERFSGRWRVLFESSPDQAVGIIDVQEQTVQGTFLTTTGDCRFLAGNIRDGTLRLAAFDGAHAFLFDAIEQADGTLWGNFWSGTSWHETWTATRDDAAALPDGFDQIHVTADPKWSEVQVHELDGTPKTLDDPSLFGALTIVNVFGSWCPNCHDEAPYLSELHGKYGSHGLKVVGLAFEASGELEQDSEQVRKYVNRHRIPYPVLLAGVSDKQEASKAIPFVDQIKAFPTTFFVDRAGRVLATYSGFSGPATGPAHEELKRRFEAIIRRELSLEKDD